MNWLKRILKATPHVHNKAGGWLGDTWTFAPPDDGWGPDVQDVRDGHIARWRCSCGIEWEERRPFNEYGMADKARGLTR